MSWLLSSNIKIGISTGTKLCALAILVGCNQGESKEEKKGVLLQFEVLSVVFDGSVEGLGNDRRGEMQAYLMLNFKDIVSETELIDSVACEAYRNARSKKNERYIIYFFKKSDVTNNEYIRDNPDEYFLQSINEDLIYEYRWINEDRRHKYRFSKNQVSIGEGVNFYCPRI